MGLPFEVVGGVGKAGVGVASVKGASGARMAEARGGVETTGEYAVEIGWDCCAMVGLRTGIALRIGTGRAFLTGTGKALRMTTGVGLGVGAE